MVKGGTPVKTKPMKPGRPKEPIGIVDEAVSGIIVRSGPVYIYFDSD